MAAVQMSQPKDAPAQAVVVSVATTGGTAMDVTAFSNLAAVDHLEFKQGNVLWEAVSGGCVPNSYMVRDRTARFNAGKDEYKKGPDKKPLYPKGQAFFIMKEESSCWCRACCNPAQPALVKFYNTGPPQQKTGMGCGPCKLDDYDTYDAVNEPVITLEKSGNCDNFAQLGPTNCFVCCACCQSHAWLHNGNVKSTQDDFKICCFTIPHWQFPEGTPGVLKNARPNAFSHAVVPIGAGGCTPTVNIMARDTAGNENQFAVVQGPTFFGGCMDLCCSTKFTVSRTGNKSGDLAVITKKNKDPGCMGLLVAMCTPADTYNLDFTPNHNLQPAEKASIIGEMVHLDFLFFEAEQPLCHSDDNACYILLCTCFCYGCLMPIQCIIPKSNN